MAGAAFDLVLFSKSTSMDPLSKRLNSTPVAARNDSPRHGFRRCAIRSFGGISNSRRPDSVESVVRQ
jgi:hypothetical protein